MYTAKCTEDGVSYAAVDFARLQAGDIARKRRFLVCIGCGGPAYFTKASRSGRAACFGARPHTDGCLEAAPKYEVDPDGRGEDQDQLKNPAHRITVDFAFGAGPKPEVREDDSSFPNSGRRGRFQTGESRPDAKSKRRLSSLLRQLMEIENFSQSEQILEIDGHGDFKVSDFFIPLLDATATHKGVFRGYWGMLIGAQRTQDNTLWFNSRGKGNLSFCIDSSEVEEFFNRYGIEDEEDLGGAYILALGKVNVSTNGKIYFPLKSKQLYTLRLLA